MTTTTRLPLQHVVLSLDEPTVFSARRHDHRGARNMWTRRPFPASQDANSDPCSSPHLSFLYTSLPALDAESTWHGETRFAALPGQKPCDASPCFASLQRKCRSGTHLLGYVRQIERQNSVSNFPGACHSCGWAFRVIRLNDQSLRRKWGLATGTVEILECAARGCLEFGARVRWKVSSTSFSVVRAKKRETLLSLDDLALNKGRLCPL